MGGEELKWRQLAHHPLMSQTRTYLVQPVQLKPMIKAQIRGRMVSSGIRDVAFGSVYSEKTCLIIMINIIITSK